MKIKRPLAFAIEFSLAIALSIAAAVTGNRVSAKYNRQAQAAERIDITLANLSILKTNKARAIQILSETTNTAPEDAAQTYDLFIAKLHVFSANGVPSNASLGPVIDALVNLGQVKPPAPPAARFFDATYVNQANAQLRR